MKVERGERNEKEKKYNPVKIINIMDEKKSKRAVNVLQWIKALVNTLITLFRGQRDECEKGENRADRKV